MKKFEDLEPGDTFPMHPLGEGASWATALNMAHGTITVGVHSAIHGWKLNFKPSYHTFGLPRAWNLCKEDYYIGMNELANNTHLIREPKLPLEAQAKEGEYK